MTEEQRKPKSWSMWIAIALALLVAYPLSLGPLQKAVVDYSLPGSLYTLHAPLIWLIRQEPKNDLTRAYWRYLNWWIGA